MFDDMEGEAKTRPFSIVSVVRVLDVFI
jgi:hypothetical protein